MYLYIYTNMYYQSLYLHLYLELDLDLYLYLHTKQLSPNEITAPGLARHACASVGFYQDGVAWTRGMFCGFKVQAHPNHRMI